jgi:transmembrane sensor
MNLSSIRRIGRPEAASEIAARWVLRQERDLLSPGEQWELNSWLAADPAHAAAYEDALWALDATARHAAEPELMALREGALAARGEGRSRSYVWGGLGGAIAASVFGLWLWTGLPATWSLPRAVHRIERPVDPSHADYATAVGERLTVSLPDSSVVTLDTDSKIRIAYSGLERGVQLLRGQALFDVAHGKALPFQVYAAGQRITAVGTLFNVRIDRNRVKVALLQGVIRVRPQSDIQSAAPARELLMRAGEVAELQPAETAAVRLADVSQVASWRGGELVFNETRLADAVAEINRYTVRPIAIADSSVGDYRITGVFRSNDPERFSQAMGEILPVNVSHSPDGAPVLRARN